MSKTVTVDGVVLTEDQINRAWKDLQDLQILFKPGIHFRVRGACETYVVVTEEHAMKISGCGKKADEKYGKDWVVGVSLYTGEWLSWPTTHIVVV